ncbi:aldehyde dehydrogenase (NADP(+)) [Herbiconiux sp. CPCC 205763]|uniref:Aldehyde dehydrogenase (NADP(+)) n=1 Tax=Herbiconiux aconitum TaxID=2970913 RepID=A0ABT2GR78_9MICO|nr:aldehyde dehydrogenase (NADP(+)) [Herbiconiux aconitum]MCS5717795.1 aldehyde dehydrogenase (NADP(+)) [Herbiconiux aconitum]
MIEIDETVTAADRAYREGSSASPTTRRGWLVAVAEALEEHRAELVELAQEETHLAAARLNGELTRTAFQLRFLGDEIVEGSHLAATIDHADPSWGMGPRPDLRSIRQAVGVVAVFGASNFPFAFSVAGGDSASALAAGCAVVHKAHPAHPRLARLTAGIVVDALRSAGAPSGLFALVEGQDEGVQLVQHPLVKAVGFTGSTRGGRALFDLVAARPEPIPFYGELGSTNPVFVTPRAWELRGQAIAEGYLDSVGLGRGQFCTKPGFLVAPASADAARTIAETARKRGDAPTLMLTPQLRESFERSLDELAAEDGFVAVVGGPSIAEEAPLTLLRVAAETVLARPELLEHEAFGPASVVVEYADEAQLGAIAALIGGQLTSTVHGEPDDEVDDLLAALSERSGRVLWNGWPTGVTVSYAQQHGGPYPAATTDTTSVGAAAITRFQRPVAYQDLPQDLLPPGLRDDNPLGIPQRVDGVLVTPQRAAAR